MNIARFSLLSSTVNRLPETDYVQLREWLWEKDWQKWDRQIEADSESGKLDFLIKEALDEKEKG
ncbi:MAG: hypothetical protein QME81_19170, partial [bacterium]|nr:hypothetical protein [bacterium]